MSLYFYFIANTTANRSIRRSNYKTINLLTALVNWFQIWKISLWILDMHPITVSASYWSIDLKFLVQKFQEYSYFKPSFPLFCFTYILMTLKTFIYFIPLNTIQWQCIFVFCYILLISHCFETCNNCQNLLTGAYKEDVITC